MCNRLDGYVKTLKDHGMDMIGTFYGTAQWASPYPEKTEHYVMPVYSAYAAKDVRDWERFVTAVVERYGDYIKEWEIWNEPFSPRSSVYWYDTPENYEKLLSSAYKIIKKKYPEADVGVAGAISEPCFKDALLAGGVGNYDSLSPHGQWADPAGFRNIEKQQGLPETKKWTNYEWHAILQRYDANRNPDLAAVERQLSRKLLFDLATQIRLGVGRVAVFETINLDEMEQLPYDRTLNHSSGMFRSKPSIEPRLPGFVLFNLVSRVQQRLDYYGEYDLGEGQKAFACSNSGKILMLFWSDADQEMAPCGKISTVLNDAQEVVDWEGKPYKSGAKLIPGIVYFAQLTDDSVLASWQKTDNVVVSPKKMRPVAPEGTVIPAGIYASIPLFDKPGVGQKPGINWNIADWKWSKITSERPEGFSARYACAVSGEYMDLVVEVTDKVHEQNQKQGEYYGGDSLQFGFDTGNSSALPQSEFQVALTAQGPVVWKTFSGYSGGDLPLNYSGESGKVSYATVAVLREGDKTIYHVRMHMGEFYPYVYKKGERLRMSLLINNNDGQGRMGYLEWSSGIGASKNAAMYGRLEMEQQ